MKKAFYLILTIFILLVFSSCTKVEYTFYIEEYDGIIVTERDDAFYDFYIKTTEGKKASIKIKTTYVLHEESVSKEYYEENKDKYPKTFEEKITYDGKKFIYRNITEKETKIYKYLTYEYIKEEIPIRKYFATEGYLLTNNPNYTYSFYMHASLSSAAIHEILFTSQIAYSKTYYKQIWFSENNNFHATFFDSNYKAHELKYENKTQNKILAYLDSLTWYIAIENEDKFFDPNKKYFRDNVLHISSFRTLKEDENNLMLIAEEGKKIPLTYRIDLINGIVIMDYNVVSTNIYQLVAKIDENDKYFFDLLTELNLELDYLSYIKPGKYVCEDDKIIIYDNGTFSSTSIYDSTRNKYYIMNNKIILTGYHTSGFNNTFNIIGELGNDYIKIDDYIYEYVE